MKRTLLFIMALAIWGCYSVPQTHAQEANNSTTIVVSSFKCDFKKMEKVRTLLNEQFGSTLSTLVEDEMLIDWGLLQHDWGDDWNFVVYYVANSKSDFFKAYDKFAESMQENYPDAHDKFFSMCSDHKDNIYQQVAGHSFNMNMAESKSE